MIYEKKVVAIALALAMSTGMVSAADYLMRPGDELYITVTQEPDLSNSTTNPNPFIVRPDGKVSFPMVGEIDAQGMTVAQFTDTLRDGLSKYIVNPDVAVNIAKLGTVRVYVFGEINRPGVYQLEKSHRVLDAIGAANGFNWDTAKKKIFLIHQDEPDKPIVINLNHILETGDMSQNYVMREGDVLYFTRNSRISFSRDIAPILTGAYMVSEIKNNTN
ncbi:polysaccharide export outer membrane protein [Megasphaera paucivorans]|uniref:Polysaccharide export outer membrane protein n=2 Tax=Megasphaera paucivorans TaxID=349095 RepID=A0A1G9VZJ1_9FIRM|nr:polysaccharide biosynthesis/export family protein [Megasphaera paucivorans]SDM77719.1 polysaccharide export outer membrane protein [Megasphaera paucivorans]